jgi:membrane associated rhomboid family serine protease
MGLKEDIQNYWRTGGVLVRLIMVNLSVFLLIGLIRIPLFLTGTTGFDLTWWLSAHSDLVAMIRKPWTVVTYMFTHQGFFHLLFNMIILYFGGRILQDLLGGARLLGAYLWGGLSGLALYIVAYQTFPVFEPVVGISYIHGASAAVMGVFFTIAAYRPDMVVHLVLIGPVKLKWIAAFYAISDLLSIDSSNPGGHIAHLGGAMFGVIAASQMRKGNDLVLGIGEWVLNLGKSKRRGKMRVEKRPKRGASKRAAPTSNDDQQARVDLILDKIGKSGYESLTKAEKDFLFKASNDK